MAKRLISADRIVGSRLRLRRKQSAITEQQLADILDVSVDEIASYEGGAARLGAVRLSRASRALDAPIGYFFAPLGAVSSAEPGMASEENLLAEPGAGELLSAYSRIASSQLRDAVLKLVLRLARESQGCVSPTLAKALAPTRRSNSQAR